MITLLIVAAIRMNEYLDNLDHMNRTTGTNYLLKKIKYLQKFRKTSIFAGIFQIALEV